MQMFGFFTRTRHQTVPVNRRRARFWLEGLETRHCPSPTINLSAAVHPGHQVLLSGQTSEGGMSVTFTGAVTGNTTSQSNGAFSYSTTSATLGVVYAQATDGSGNQTNVAQNNVSVASPGITLGVTYAMNSKNVTLSGQVTDLDAAGLTVTFTGEVTGSCTVQQGGSFSFTAAATALGNVTAKVCRSVGPELHPVADTDRQWSQHLQFHGHGRAHVLDFRGQSCRPKPEQPHRDPGGPP